MRIADPTASWRRLPALVGIAAGLALAVVPLVIGLFGTAAAADRVLDDVEPIFSEANLGQLREVIDVGGAGVAELQPATDALRQTLDISSEEFAARYPATAAAVEVVGSAGADAERTVANLEAQADGYDEARQLPGLGVPMRAAPWIAVATGLGLVAVGVLAWRRPSRGSSAALGVVAVAMVAFPLALRYPDRLDAANDVLDSISPSAAGVAKTDAQIAGTRAAVDELQSRVIPDAATAAGVPTARFDAALEQSFPAFSAVLAQSDELLAPFEEGAEFRRARTDDLVTLKDAPIGALLWLLVIPGALLVVAVVGAAAAGQVGGLGSMDVANNVS